MRNADHGSASPQPNAILLGGPAETLDIADRIRHVDEPEETVKLFLGNCYDHYLSSGETHTHEDGRRLRVFAYAYRTYVAE